jgi:hypothetical protein
LPKFFKNGKDNEKSSTEPKSQCVSDRSGLGAYHRYMRRESRRSMNRDGTRAGRDPLTALGRERETPKSFTYNFWKGRSPIPWS